MSDNTNLNKAFTAKNDEFYTSREYVDQIIDFMKDYLKGKKVYCNCDMPWSEFTKAFIDRYHELGLVGLKCTGMDGKDFRGTLTEYDGKEVRYSKLEWSGSFNSYECVDILNDWCDVCISNPPFSIIKDYYTVLKQSGKDFLFISPMNVAHYKSFVDDYISGNIHYIYSDFFFKKASTFLSDNSVKYVRNQLCTNISEIVRYRTYKLYKKFNDSFKYLDQTYKGEKILNINKSSDIPVDYPGYMAIPITNMITINLKKRFDVFGLVQRPITESDPSIDGKRIYERLIIRNKHCDGKQIEL